MENTKTNSFKGSYLTATGELKVTLRNDLLFHYVLQKSKKALTNLVCSLKGLNPNDVQDVVVTNPINYAEYTGKQIILDVQVILNDNEILDLELQIYKDPNWKSRSFLYLCRAYDSIDAGDSFGKLKPTTLIEITDSDIFPEHPEFYSHFLFKHEEKNYPYSTKLRINVLYLNRIELASDTDKEYQLDFWAKLFKSETWEDLKKLAEINPIGREVAEVMYKATVQSEEKTLFEAHQRYLDYMTAAKDCGIQEGYETAKSELQPIIDSQKLELLNKDKEIEAKKQEIARLKALLEIKK